jgi:CheY-like chemotaxis protein
MDGYQATTMIRKVEEKNRIMKAGDHLIDQDRAPIIAMTAHATKADKDKCLQAGMDDYVAKPLRRKELLNIVNKWIKSAVKFNPRGTSFQPIDDRVGEESPMDFERATDEFEGDKDFLMDVMTGFFDNIEIQIETIHQAISDGDSEKVWQEAHSIKGGAANLTAEKLSQTAFELETMGKSENLKESREALGRLKIEYNCLKSYASSRISIRNGEHGNEDSNC